MFYLRHNNQPCTLGVTKKSPLEELSSDNKKLQENSNYLSQENTKLNNLIEKCEESSDCFREAMEIYSKDVQKMKLRLRQTAVRTKLISDRVFGGQQASGANTQNFNLSSQFSEYQNSMDGITQRLEQLEKVTLRTFEHKFSQYQSIKRRKVNELEKEIKLLKEA